MQRLRVRFSRCEEIKYISHLDLMRLWERALRRASVPIAYSEGFTPHPRISLAAPLPIGVTSEGELMDVFLQRRLPLLSFIKAAGNRLPSGVDILEGHEVPPTMPSLQSQVRYTEYLVEVETENGVEEIGSHLSSLLSLKELPWQHKRDTGVRRYDLRALIDDLWLEEKLPSGCIFGMRLRVDNSGAGRPEQVALALGFPDRPRSIHRTRIILAERRL